MTVSEIYQTAMQYLAQREHSQYQLVIKLRQRGFCEEEVAETLQALIEQDLQSDSRFTQAYIESRVHRGYGPQRIRSELNTRGIEDPLIDEYLNENDELWWQRAMVVKNKKFGHGSNVDHQTEMKQKSFLQYRGFTFDQIHKVFAAEHEAV